MEFFFSTIIVTLVIGPIALLIILFIRTNDLARKVQELQQRLGYLQGASKPESSKLPAQVMPRSQPAPQAPPPGISAEAAQLRIDRPPSRSREEWEAMIGGKLLNRIGALALIIAVGFFLKYAFDNNWITETVRVLIGIGLGILCLLGAYRTNRKGFEIFAQGLVGAGISILYLSLYASFNFYHLIPQWTAFLLMSGVTLVALVQALAYDSIAVSILGWAGGFLTPFMLSTGESNELALFTYTALLALGLLALAVKKESWFALEPLTLFATIITFFAWFAEFYTPADFALTCLFATMFWLLFHGSETVRIRLGLKRFRELRHTVQPLNGFFLYLALLFLLERHHEDLIGSAAFGLGILYAATLIGLQRLGTLDRGLEARFGLIASAFLLTGTAVEFESVATIRLWSLEAFLLLWLGVYSRRGSLRVASLAFYVLAVGLFIFSDGSLSYTPISGFTLLLNDRVLTALVLAGAFGFGTLLVSRPQERSILSLRPWLGIGFFMILFTLLTVETNDYFRRLLWDLRENSEGRPPDEEITRLQNLRQLSLSGIWLLYSIVLMVIGILRGVRGPRFIAMALFGLAILKIFIVDLSFLQTLYRIFSFFGLGVILLAVSYMYQRYKSLLFGQPTAQP